MALTDSLKALCVETARSLQGSARRLFMARTVKERGSGGQRHAARARGWSRVPIRQGPHELESGCTCLDAFAARGRKRVEAHVPTVLPDSTAIVESQSQTDPQCRTTRRSTRLSAAAVRRQRIAQHGDTDDTLPTVQTLTTTRNALGYSPTKVAKSPPQKTAQPPTPSARREPRAPTPPMRQTTSGVSQWMRTRPSQLAPSPGAGRVASRSRLPTTMVRPRQRERPWASSCHPWVRCVWTGGLPQ